MNPAMAVRNEKLTAKVAANLKKRRFEAYVVKTGDEARELALKLIPKGDTVSWGGSMTIREIGLTDALKASGDYNILDRDAVPDEERVEVMRQALLADTYVMSVNGLSEDGQLVNLDGGGNRVGAMIYGPKSVIVIAGVNKIVRTLDDAVTRARTVAAPINAQRFGGVTGCHVNGTCENCLAADCICSVLATVRLCKPTGRIKVILVQEELGF